MQVQIEPDGSLRVVERITYDFFGDFSGAYREIPLREGESINDVSVSEDGRAYRPGASGELGSSGSPDTFGTARTDGGLRIVWHYRAFNEIRTFEIAYRLSGLAVAYDDVVDVNLQVWGDEWEVGLDRLTAVMRLPGRAGGPDYGVWGHPVWVRGDVIREPSRAVLRAIDVPARQCVELRVVFPRDLLVSTTGARVADGNGLARIVAAERGDAASYEADRERIDSAVDHVGRTAGYLLGLALGPPLVLIGLVWGIFGRERRPRGYDREYEQEPPSELAPALVPPLLRQGTDAGSNEFTATLFDLIRRGRYVARAVTTERKVWAGLRTEQVADLELSLGEAVELTTFEDAVDDVVRDVLDGGSERLSRFRERIE